MGVKFWSRSYIAYMITDKDKYWLQAAILLANQALSMNEVPVGAILVHEDKIVGSGFNCPISTHDPTAHAEIMALRNSASTIKNYRLINTTLYTTLEPCLMCAGAIIHARVKKLVFGAFDTKAGVILSQYRIFDQTFLNHHVEYIGGIMAEQCGNLLSTFFKKKRESKYVSS